jgi:hypothetical protein
LHQLHEKQESIEISNQTDELEPITHSKFETIVATGTVSTSEENSASNIELARYE